MANTRASRVRTPVRLLVRLLAVLASLCLVATACTSGFDFGGDPTVSDGDPTVSDGDPADFDGEGGPSGDTGPTDENAAEGSGDQDPDAEDPGAGDEDAGEGADERPARVEQEEASDRIAVQTIDGQLFTVTPDGGDRIDLTDPDTLPINQQPTWAPDASRIAWVGISRDRVAQLHTSRFDLTGSTVHAVDSAPFYLNWDPSSSQVAFLAPSAAGIDLGLAALADSPGEDEPDQVGPTVRLDRGEPYFFSWGPDGDELLVHASAFRLDRINVDGSTRVIDEFPARFQAPVWLGEADTFVYADERNGETFLVTTGSLGEGRIELASFRGFLNFTVNDPGTYAALLTRQPQTGVDDGGAVTASFSTAQFQPDEERVDLVDVLPFNTLGFIALYGGDLQTVSNNNVVAFWWDPTGDLLAWLEPGSPGQLQWWFSDRREVWSGAQFTPSQTFATSYLPFFDQYAQSHTFFSPDGSQITFAGALSNGESGVFVMDTSADSVPEKIADGVFAVWSPTTAGGGASVL